MAPVHRVRARMVLAPRSPPRTPSSKAWIPYVPVRVRPLYLGTVLAAALVAGCERPPSAGSLKEWTPADHDRAEEEANSVKQGPNQGAQLPGSAGNAAPTTTPPAPMAKAGSEGAPAGAANLVEVTWETACATCHGPTGHGDGPNGPMVNAPDITRDDLLSKMTDEDIANQIKNGKNRMPKFDLPDAVVRGLVARVRANRGR